MDTTTPVTVDYSSCGPKLAAAMVKVQAALKPARKVKENPHLRAKYSDLAAVWEAAHEALTDAEVAVLQPFNVTPAGLPCLDTVLLHASGERLVGRYLLRPVKDDPQGYGSAGTYARRYSLAAMVGIVQDDDDGIRATTRGKAANLDKAKDAAGLISAAQRIALKKVWTKAGKTDAQVKEYLREAYDLDSTDKIKAADYQDLMAWCAETKPNAESA